MARIRTIKPDFFRHEVLFEAEQATGLPLRIAYAGLWTAADREGRFEWRPRTLKLDCLPHDDVDFAEVLDALVECGRIIRYEVDGREYGCIPTWHEHQKPNQREKQSEIPPHDDARARTCTHVGKGKGREHSSFSARTRDPEPEALPPLDANGRSGIHAEFDQFMDAYPEKIGRKAASVVWPEARRSADLQTILDGLEHYVRNKPPDRNWMSPATFLENERWTDRYAERSSNGQRQSASGADNLGAALAELVDEERAGRRGEADAGGWGVDHDRPEGHSGGGGTVVDLRAVGTGIR